MSENQHRYGAVRHYDPALPGHREHQEVLLRAQLAHQAQRCGLGWLEVPVSDDGAGRLSGEFTVRRPPAHLQIDRDGTLHQVAPLPSATRGRDVVGDIDDVLTDWHGSVDASSWHPDGVYPQPIGPVYRRPRPPVQLHRTPSQGSVGLFQQRLVDRGWRPPVQELTPEQWDRVTQLGTNVARALQEFVATAVEAVSGVADALRDLGYTVTPPAPDPDPVDPRAHALAARRSRHTGPPPPALDPRRRR